MFYVHKGMKSGHLNKCKKCCKLAQVGIYNKNKSDKDWVVNEKKRTRDRYHKLNYKGKYKPTQEQKAASIKKYRDKYPERRIANKEVEVAIRLKKII